MRGWLLVLLAGVALAQKPPARVGIVDFFGYEGLDVAAVRKALPPLQPAKARQQVTAAVRAVLGKDPTDVALVCCDDRGDAMVYIGLPGGSTRAFPYHAAPIGTDRFPRSVQRLSDQAGRALLEAVRRGDSGEDDSQGYALAHAPALRALQFKLRDYARGHAADVYRVLEHSGSAGQRALAAELLGYLPPSDQQLAALVRAARDPDGGVRNNATRALGVLVNARPEMASRIPPADFIAMLWSPRWTDRNKAGWLLDSIARTGNAELLEALRNQALIPLQEMAAWQNPGHSGFARSILARLARR